MTLFIAIRVAAGMLLIMVKPTDTFFTRAAELMCISNLTVNMLKMLKSQQCDCAIDFDHFHILASDSDSFRLLF